MNEIRAFMLMLAIGNISYAVLMAGYSRTGRPDRSMKIWTWAKLIEGAGFLAFWLRPSLPPATGVLLSNGLLIAAAVGEALAYTTFLGYRWQRGLLGLFILGEGLLLATVAFDASAAQRVLLMSLVLATIAGLNGLIMIGTGPRFSLLRCIIGLPNLLVAFAFFWRAWVASGSGLDVYTPSPSQTTVYLGAYFLLVVNGFGFLLLCKQKDEARLRELATTDSLTGLANRHCFLAEAERAQAQARRLGQPLSLLMLDIDHFKRMNDGHGHAFGDRALQVFAAAAGAALRRGDLLGRLGGEEFAVLLPATDAAGAFALAERLRRAVATAALEDQGERMALTVSIGVATLGEGDGIGTALGRADKALYRAKRAGRNRVEQAEDPLDRAIA
ncbi:hypothetical protein B0920_10785 [Massilia sp. KIM]|uniref:GGDEF domain-containing protein n=1 Tax=Massilia sp. KIM TaxID=1955422 RepID=UPI00098EA614|nr:GGDEF domain-containing protein [Massilia sp. KIM]OON63807.1 hypothetical protein B0920_10785 [Massilia sp. KIM]